MPANIPSPFAAVDMERLDRDFPSMLREGSRLSAREKRLFRLGLFTGLGEWELAGEALGSLADEGLLNAPEVERATAEAGMVKGLPACRHLAPLLASRGLRSPADVAEAVQMAGESGLSKREVFALGLGITWGARCWDT